MKKVISIGEALIDFIPHEKGVALKDVSNFFRVAGGAPLNVAAAVAKLGGKAQMLTKLGVDGFGDHILEEVSPLGVDVSKVLRTKEANTALAFVSLKEDGERDFSFYRNPSADMLLEANEVKKTELIVNRLRMDMVKRGDMMSVEDVCDILAIPLLGAVPDDEHIVIATNQGEPLVGTDCLAGQAYSNICKRILGETVEFLNLEEKQTVFDKLKNLFKKN